MKIILTNQECEDLFVNALCLGMIQMLGHDISVCYDQKDYARAARKLRALNNGRSQPFESVLMQILRNGGMIRFVDEQVEEYSTSITLDTIYSRMPDVPFRYLSDSILERDDSDTADAILQYIAYGEIIFG